MPTNNYLAVYYPSGDSVISRMLKLVEPKSSDTLFDLGAGDGRVLIEAAKVYHCRGVGIELCGELMKEAETNVKNAGLEHLIEMRQQDAKKTDVTAATIIALYLSEVGNREIMNAIAPKLQPGTKIVSHYFPVEGWENKLVRTCSLDNLSIYLYQTGQTDAGAVHP